MLYEKSFQGGNQQEIFPQSSHFVHMKRGQNMALQYCVGTPEKHATVGFSAVRPLFLPLLNSF